MGAICIHLNIVFCEKKKRREEKVFVGWNFLRGSIYILLDRISLLSFSLLSPPLSLCSRPCVSGNHNGDAGRYVFFLIMF